eukprot:765546-Hanusia_phi.AAC.2
MEEETRTKMLSRFDTEQVAMLQKLMGTQLDLKDSSLAALEAILVKGNGRATPEEVKSPLKDPAPASPDIEPLQEEGRTAAAEEVKSPLKDPASPDIEPSEVQEDERRAGAELVTTD